MKINDLLKKMPKGSVLTSNWLKNYGVSSKLAWWYVKSGWFERVASGMYKLAGDSITWVSALQALQQQLRLPVHVGGKTALQLLGQSHYVPTGFGQQDIQLFAPQGIKLPRWINSASWEATFKLFTTQLFDGSQAESVGLLEQVVDGLKVQLSSPERAALEVCYLVPKAVTFQEAALLMENLSRLRPKYVHAMLEGCQSIKAKRLFLYLAEYYQHGWVNELNLKQLNLGEGKQVIAGGGEYSTKYKISVPSLGEFH